VRQYPDAARWYRSAVVVPRFVEGLLKCSYENIATKTKPTKRLILSINYILIL
jgi:hypothetical protein